MGGESLVGDFIMSGIAKGYSYLGGGYVTMKSRAAGCATSIVILEGGMRL